MCRPQALHLISSHRIASHLISQHRISYHHISSHLIVLSRLTANEPVSRIVLSPWLIGLKPHKSNRIDVALFSERTRSPLFAELAAD